MSKAYRNSLVTTAIIRTLLAGILVECYTLRPKISRKQRASFG